MKDLRLRLPNILMAFLLALTLAGAVAAQTNEKKIAAANDLVTEAYNLFEQGTSESYRAALEKFQTANRLYEEAGDKSENVGISLLASGLILDRLGEKPDALKFYGRALAFSQANNYQELESTILNNIAVFYADSGEGEKALDYYEQILRLNRQIGSKLNEGAVLSNIGAIYNRLGERQKALDYFNQALLVLRAAGDKRGEAQTLSNIGLVYVELRETLKAVEYYLQSLSLSRETGDKASEASTLNNIGGVYADLSFDDSSRKALEYFKQALPIRQAIGDKSGAATTLNNIGAAYDNLGEKQKALEHYNQALSLHRAVGNRSGEARTLHNLGELYSDLGEKQKALEYFQLSLSLNKRIGNKAAEAMTLASLRYYWNNQKNPRYATFYGKQAVAVYQQLRSNIAGLDKNFQRSYLKSIEAVYRNLAEILINENRLAEAQQVLNLFKDQQFFDFNRNPNDPIKQLVETPRESALSLRYNRSIQKIGEIERRLDDLKITIGNREPQAEESARMRKLESDLKNSTDDFLLLLKQSADEFAKPADTSDKVPSVPDLIEMQKTLRDLERQTGEKTVAVYTLVGADNFRALIVSPDSIKDVSSEIKHEDLNNLASHYWKLLQSDKHDPSAIAKQVYGIVFKPLETKLPKETTTIMWSLDGDLRYLPMAALYDGEKYLIERYSHVVFTRPDSERLTRDLKPNWTALGLGSSKAHEVEVLDEKFAFNSLPGTTEELSKILKQSGQDDGIFSGELLEDEQFTKPAMLAALKQKRPLVHIASHFAFRPGDETRSFLLLGDGSALTLDEMKRQTDLFAGVDLLTLSACETAAARADAHGIEVDGFAELAQRLGAGAVIASLWQVADESTAQLMSDFYSLKTNDPKLTKASAMRQAQLAMLRGAQKIKGSKQRRSDLANATTNDEKDFAQFAYDEKKPFAHPYYWSPFVLIGNWR